MISPVRRSNPRPCLGSAPCEAVPNGCLKYEKGLSTTHVLFAGKYVVLSKSHSCISFALVFCNRVAVFCLTELEEKNKLYACCFLHLGATKCNVAVAKGMSANGAAPGVNSLGKQDDYQSPSRDGVTLARQYGVRGARQADCKVVIQDVVGSPRQEGVKAVRLDSVISTRQEGNKLARQEIALWARHGIAKSASRAGVKVAELGVIKTSRLDSLRAARGDHVQSARQDVIRLARKAGVSQRTHDVIKEHREDNAKWASKVGNKLARGDNVQLAKQDSVQVAR